MEKRNKHTIQVRGAHVLQRASLKYLRMIGAMGGEGSLSRLQNDLAGAEWIPYRSPSNIFGAGGRSERRNAGDQRKSRAVSAKKRNTKKR